jgi:uncharacterized protein YecE (DUF72 family)
MPAPTLRIGTSGWHYAHWRGVFYPDEIPAGEYLAYYVRYFDTVEINNSFYQLPVASTLITWKNTVPPGFLFAVKASSYITHRKKLKEPAATTARFFERIAALGEKLGPVLFQLPPRWRVNAARLDEFLTALPPGFRYAFELRDPSWFHPQVEAVLRRHNAAFCIYEFDWRLSPLLVTADFVYLRLHGPQGAYRGRYGRRGLRPWAERIRAWRAEGLSIYVYFDNDEGGLRRSGRSHPSRVDRLSRGSLGQDAHPSAFDPPPPGKHDPDGFGIDAVLLLEDSSRERFHRVVLEHRHSGLHDNRSVV